MGHRTEGIHHIALVGHAGVLADELLIGAKAIPAKGGVSVPGDGRRSPAERELAIEALRKLIGSAAVPAAPPVWSAALGVLGRLAREVPCYRMAWSPEDPPFARLASALGF